MNLSNAWTIGSKAICLALVGATVINSRRSILELKKLVRDCLSAGMLSNNDGKEVSDRKGSNNFFYFYLNDGGVIKFSLRDFSEKDVEVISDFMYEFYENAKCEDLNLHWAIME